uniref:Transposase n=1 Tax=Candidatus Kentrum sp. FW TaxID=2126338 RepID=A0A450TNJ9_9GAMM|nr:MAG: hypothetical protein BECKFW1821A_GA0114235_103725 [Candidatus Kentron sp. FW]VFJ69336.1 MAG: hypothetical protein BECKFW1821B_GA0114236_11636 [Candidatus Kentron sp. FW]
MTNSIKKGQLKTAGIDIAKQSFQIYGVDGDGHILSFPRVNR